MYRNVWGQFCAAGHCRGQGWWMVLLEIVRIHTAEVLMEYTIRCMAACFLLQFSILFCCSAPAFNFGAVQCVQWRPHDLEDYLEQLLRSIHCPDAQLVQQLYWNKVRLQTMTKRLKGAHTMPHIYSTTLRVQNNRSYCMCHTHEATESVKCPRNSRGRIDFNEHIPFCVNVDLKQASPVQWAIQQHQQALHTGEQDACMQVHHL